MAGDGQDLRGLGERRLVVEDLDVAGLDQRLEQRRRPQLPVALAQRLMRDTGVLRRGATAAVPTE